MKKTYRLLTLLIIGILLVNSCKKDNDETIKEAERGKIISYNKTGTITADQIKLILSFVSTDFSSKGNFTYDIETYTVVYETIDTKGEAIKASGLLVIPKNVDKSLPIMSFQHGTVLEKYDVPSSSGTGKEVGWVFGTDGYIAVLPDFLGLGQSTGLHPYVHAETEASASVDMLRAAKKILVELNITHNNQLFLMGYSQGGHATMALHKAIQEKHSAEFTVTASSPMAGPYDLSGVMADIMLKKEVYPTPGYLPYVLYSYNPIYNIYDDIDNVFKSPYNTLLPQYFNSEHKYNLSSVNNNLPSIPSDILKEDILETIKNDKSHKFWLALKDNDLYDWKPVSPVKMFHCDADLNVPYQNSVNALNKFKENGATDVSLINPLQGGNHSTCLIPSLIAAKEWFNSFKK